MLGTRKNKDTLKHLNYWEWGGSGGKVNFSGKWAGKIAQLKKKIKWTREITQQNGELILHIEDLGWIPGTHTHTKPSKNKRILEYG